ncbi:hypothetical protein ACWF2L_25915 [Streptomyces anulatus]
MPHQAAFLWRLHAAQRPSMACWLAGRAKWQVETLLRVAEAAREPDDDNADWRAWTLCCSSAR